MTEFDRRNDPLARRLSDLLWWRQVVLPVLEGGESASALTPGWWGKDVAPVLGTQESVAVVTAATIYVDRQLCGRPLGDLLPGLERLSVGDPASHLETVRAQNVVRRRNVHTWGALAQHSADAIGTWPNAGRKVVTEVIRGALAAWAQDAVVFGDEVAPSSPAPAEEPGLSRHVRTMPSGTRATSTPALEDNAGASERESDAHSHLAELLRNAALAGYRAGASTFGEALALARSGELSSDAWRQLMALRLDEVTGVAGDAQRAWAALLTFDERELAILAGRVFTTGRKLTLNELGEKLGITRERVRQLESRVKEAVHGRLQGDEKCAPIAHAAARLRRRLGPISTEREVELALREILDEEEPDRQVREAVLLHLAGPYRLEAGFWQSASVLETVTEQLMARRDEPLNADDIEELLAAAGVASQALDAVAGALPLHAFDDRLLVWTGSLNDKACLLLRVHGEPMSREQLHSAMGPDDVNFRSLVNAVQGDERIRRLGLNSYGLADWGGEEYTTIADEIEEAIQRRGGRAPVDEIVEELVAWFGVSAQSVRSYAASRRFHRDRDGQLTVAPADASPARTPRMPPELDRDLVLRGGGWVVRVRVDRDVMRGSGRPTRSAVAQAAGVWPGDARTIELSNGSAAISWRGPQPAFGSTRALVEELGCAIGDLLFVPLDDGAAAFFASCSEIEAATGLGRVAAELGLPADAPLNAVAETIGLEPDASAADIRTRLRARRQEDLAELVPEDPEADDDVLEQLMGLGE